MVKKRRLSIKFYTILILSVIWGLLFIMITAYGHLTRKTLISEVRSANEKMLKLYSAQIDSLYTEINRCLAQTALPEDRDSYLSSSIPDELSDYVLLYDDKFSFFFSDDETGNTILKTASNISGRERDNILDLLNDIETSCPDGRWNIIRSNEEYYAVRCYSSCGYHVGAWISLDNALNLYKDNQFDESAVLFFTDSKENILSGISEYPEKYSGDFLTLSETIPSVNLNLSLLIPYERILSGFNFITIIQWLIVGAFVLCVAVILYYISFFLLKPLKSLSEAMKEVENGNYTITLNTDRTTREFHEVYSSFNEMVSEINYLKTSVYERELFNQRLELEKLQLQVKPHFYLNCLNIIYNLAQVGKSDLIQELCMAQIKYFRYMMKSSFSTVKIKDEFAHIENYLHIQQLRYPGKYNITLSLNSEIEDILIPPLCLHVFAENVIKHVNSHEKIDFAITAEQISSDRIMISISDNGPGFSEEVLEKLNKKESPDNENGNHIGIYNTIKRLDLMYGEASWVTFANINPGGASIKIQIPQVVKEEDGFESVNDR